EPPGNAPETADEIASPVPVDVRSAELRLGDACAWTQWGGGAAHDGQTCRAGQDPTNIQHQLVYDPFQTQEIAEGGGVLFVHYQVPLNDHDGNFYMMQK